VYDEEIVLTLSDLYHDQAPSLINYYQSPDNENTYGGTEPVPDSILINEAQNVQVTIIPGKTYLFRIVNMGAMISQWLQFDQHSMMVVEMDGVYIQPYYTEQLFMTVAQRYSVIVTALPTAGENFAIVSAMMTDMFDQSKYPADMDTTVSNRELRMELIILISTRLPVGLCMITPSPSRRLSLWFLSLSTIQRCSH
jgi:iron transport multicopper oxidase